MRQARARDQLHAGHRAHLARWLWAKLSAKSTPIADSAPGVEISSIQVAGFKPSRMGATPSIACTRHPLCQLQSLACMLTQHSQFANMVQGCIQQLIPPRLGLKWAAPPLVSRMLSFE